MDYTSREVYEYVSKKSNDPIVEWKKCRISWQEFPIYKSDLEFYEKVGPEFEVSQDFANKFFEENNDVKDSFEYEDWRLKAKIPTPTLCPEEREAQRFSFRNENHLYRWKCSLSWKNIITTISPDKDYIIYEYKHWLSDNREPIEFWVENLSKKNSLVMADLLHQVPVRDKFWRNNENSDYVNITKDSKNSYMCFGSSLMEDCLYVSWCVKWETCVDCLFCTNCRDCYECIDMDNCFNLSYSNNCKNCSNSSYMYNCTNCNDCFNCSNLNNKSHYINDEPHTKEEYLKLLPSLKPETIEIKQLWLYQVNSEDSFWNSLFNCKKAVFVWTWAWLDNVKYSSAELSADNCYDTFTSWHSCIYTITWAYSYFSWCLVFSFDMKNSRYCVNCFNCTNCFGCVWLKYKNYCIYNKQYTKEEYNQIVPKIIAQMIRDKEWWEFFNPQLSYYWYNETLAMDYHPMTKEEALKKWYKWSDYESPMPHVEKNIQWKDLPKQWCRIIKEKKPEILEKILNYAVICEVSQRPFRITKQEIEFYIRHNIPLPTKHPDVRHQERFARKDPAIMHLIHCDGCWEEMLSVHKPWRWKKVLCEECFYKEI